MTRSVEPIAGGADAKGKLKVTPEIAAEAAVWVARLHGHDRCKRMERECLAWQQRSPAHREAFERCTDTWESVPRVSVASVFAASRRGPSRDARSVLRALPMRRVFLGVVAIGLSIAAIGHALLAPDATYVTEVGEQQTVVLEDGSRVSLNTDTRVRVRMSRGQRLVSVLGGEALFEVAPQAHRPFIVRAAGSEVEAVGTVFTVRLTTSPRRDAPVLAVTLLEGRVAVRQDDAAAGSASAVGSQLRPGERLQIAPGGERGPAQRVQRVDRPNLEQILAWKRSEALFDSAALSDAVEEMNRYSRTPIVLLGADSLASLQVSGQYRTGDNRAFASAVAALHGLRVHEVDGRLELSSPQ
ncbi:MAG: FecR domain-containing protein [Burkholderiaceae bacterium]|nr:FecR domain-containing protein [Burkholderiaceae bacterium]